MSPKGEKGYIYPRNAQIDLVGDLIYALTSTVLMIDEYKYLWLMCIFAVDQHIG